MSHGSQWASRLARLLTIAAIVLTFALRTHDASAVATTIRVSVGSDGSQFQTVVNRRIGMTPDGRFVTFTGNLGSSGERVWVRDLVLGTTEMASVDSAGNPGNGTAGEPAISDDGRFVAFHSHATNLVPNDTNGLVDVFVRDRLVGTTERVSVDSNGAQAAGDTSQSPDISADGRFITFFSGATNLVSGDTNGRWDVFLHDRQTGVTERVSVSSTGQQAQSFVPTAAAWPSISSDGRFVAFEAWAYNLVPNDTNGKPDIFLRDRLNGTTQRISVATDGTQADDTSVSAELAGEGRFVAFGSAASNLVAGDTNGIGDAFIHDLLTGITERVSVDGSGNQVPSGSSEPVPSADGRFVVFESSAFDLVPDDTNGVTDVFLRDRVIGTTTRASLGETGNEGNGTSRYPVLSSDATTIAFYSEASNLVADDTNAADIFARAGLCPPVPWPTPIGDDDCDGWSSTDEGVIGTYPTDACPATGVVSHGAGYENDEDPDAWPADMNDDQVVNLADILFLAPPVFFSVGPNPPYQLRYDLNLDGVINLSDILYLAPPVFFSTCTP